MSVLFNHTIRHGFGSVNPIRLVRQSAKRKKIPLVLTPDEIQKLIAALPLKEGALVFLLTIDVVSRRRRESWVIEQRCLSGSQAVPVSR
jgi:hypothetical protein